MILRSAEVLSCNVVYTEGLNAGQQYGSVQAVDPFAHTS